MAWQNSRGLYSKKLVLNSNSWLQFFKIWLRVKLKAVCPQITWRQWNIVKVASSVFHRQVKTISEVRNGLVAVDWNIGLQVLTNIRISPLVMATGWEPGCISQPHSSCRRTEVPDKKIHNTPYSLHPSATAPHDDCQGIYGSLQPPFFRTKGTKAPLVK